MVQTTRIHQKIPSKLHKQAKAAASLMGITLKDFVIKALEEKVHKIKYARMKHTEKKGDFLCDTK